MFVYTITSYRAWKFNFDLWWLGRLCLPSPTNTRSPRVCFVRRGRRPNASPQAPRHPRYYSIISVNLSRRKSPEISRVTRGLRWGVRPTATPNKANTWRPSICWDEWNESSTNQNWIIVFDWIYNVLVCFRL